MRWEGGSEGGGAERSGGPLARCPRTIGMCSDNARSQGPPLHSAEEGKRIGVALVWGLFRARPTRGLGGARRLGAARVGG